MIPHHAQAKEMSALAESRTNNEAILAVAARITLSQDDEIAMMQDWLGDRGLEVTAEDAHHQSGFMRMAGMLTDEEMAALAAARGSEFDRLYLENMIQHHQGALDMVEDLLDQRGSVQDPLLYEFTSDVTSDQTSEIERMVTLLASFSSDPRVGLAAGFRDAGEASLNMQLVATLPKPAGFLIQNDRRVCQHAALRNWRPVPAATLRKLQPMKRTTKTPTLVPLCSAFRTLTCFSPVTILLPVIIMGLTLTISVIQTLPNILPQWFVLVARETSLWLAIS